ncbi:MAG: hypothetical protein QOE87_1895 [Gaiellales bacterium]|nr:hypothetical protein [Gaiellales bacterium]
MTALPSNLAMVGDDLARATQRDARRAIQRRRLVTYAIALGLLAIMASAAIANGWLLDETPTAQAVPSLGQSASGAEARTLLSNLGSEGRVLSSVTTAGGAVCLVLTGYQMQCVPTFRNDQQLALFIWSTRDGKSLVWGVVRPDVTAVDAVTADGRTTRALLANDAYYVELGSPPTKLIAQLSDGSSSVVPVADCPPSDPFYCPA